MNILKEYELQNKLIMVLPKDTKNSPLYLNSIYQISKNENEL